MYLSICTVILTIKNEFHKPFLIICRHRANWDVGRLSDELFDLPYCLSPGLLGSELPPLHVAWDVLWVISPPTRATRCQWWRRGGIYQTRPGAKTSQPPVIRQRVTTCQYRIQPPLILGAAKTRKRRPTTGIFLSTLLALLSWSGHSSVSTPDISGWIRVEAARPGTWDVQRWLVLDRCSRNIEIYQSDKLIMFSIIQDKYYIKSL